MRPHGLRHASITSVLTLSADRGLPLPEVLAVTGHAQASIAVVLAWSSKYGAKPPGRARPARGGDEETRASRPAKDRRALAEAGKGGP